MLELNLPPETEARLRERAQAAGKDVATFLREVVEGELQGEELTPRQDRLAALEAFAKSHRPLPHPADDGRDAIYGNRGE